MAEVHILIQENWQEYEGGGDEILSIWGSESKALTALRAELEKHGKGDAKTDSEGKYQITGSPSLLWLRVDKWAVQ